MILDFHNLVIADISPVRKINDCNKGSQKWFLCKSVRYVSGFWDAAMCIVATAMTYFGIPMKSK